MADIFNEIDEELRADKARAFWQKYGNHLIAAALLLVLAAALWWGWQRYDDYRRQQASVDFLNAVQAAAQDNSTGAGALDRVAAQGGGYGALARFQLASNAAAKDPAKAADLLASIAGDDKVDAPMRGIAAIEAGLLKLQLNKPADALQVVQPLTAEGNAYRLSALEVTGLAQLAGGDKVKARDTFTQLQQAASAPTGGSTDIAARAQQMLDRLQQ